MKDKTSSTRQKRFIDKKKILNSKMLQFYVSNDVKTKLLVIKYNSFSTSEIIEKLINAEYKRFIKRNIKKDIYDF